MSHIEKTGAKSKRKQKILIKKSHITYIKNHVHDLTIQERLDVLNLIINSPINDNKIYSKGNGTMIRFEDMTNETIWNIYNKIKTIIDNKINQLKEFSEEDISEIEKNAEE
jgi:hypothetical protein